MKAEAEPLTDTTGLNPERKRRLWPEQWCWRLSLLALIALVLFGAAIWIGRERIAGNLIDDALDANGLVASYDIVEIGPQRQVIANVVVGDPDAPDLTVERVNVDIAFSYGSPGIGGVELIRPRLFGTLRDGALSFGALDPLIFAESDAEPGLPAFGLALVDGRALIESDYGAIGAKVDGAGRLDDGFEGTLAVTAPGLGVEDCSAEAATVYGALSTASGRATFDGPVRLRGLACQGAQMASADVATRLTLSEDFSAVEGTFDLASSNLSQGANALSGLSGTGDFAWRFAGEEEGTLGALSLRHDLRGEGLSTPYAQLAEFAAEGSLRTSDNMTRSEWTSEVSGEGFALGIVEDNALADARAAAAGTLGETLLAKLERGLNRSLPGAALRGDITVRTNEDGLRAIIPEARLRGEGGDTLLALSRISYASDADGSGARMTGNILTGGPDLPRINGRMEQVGGGDFALRMTMAEYRAGGDAIAIPRFELRQNARGGVTFNGMVQAEGSIAGGEVRGLVLPLEGAWTSGSGLAIGRRCTDVRIAGLDMYNLSLSERSFSLCPTESGAIARYRNSFELAAQTRDLELVGALSGSPTQITAARAILRYPGPFEVEGLNAVIGAPDSAVRLTAATLTGAFDETIGGTFDGGSAALDIVPLDLDALSGTWSYQDSILRVGDGAFILTERVDPDTGALARFEPLTAQGATLTLEDGNLRADAELRATRGATLVTRIAIQHDLGTGAGRADIDVPGVTFSDAFQPEDLTYLTKGVIAAAEGTVSGSGEVLWTADSIDSSGTFRSDNFDFAAAFGPVRGVRGKITFTDLVGLTTAPSQVLEVGSVNAGIEALAGRLTYSMVNGEIIRIEGGRWPFMGGELILRPVTINYGTPGGQSYVFEIVELDAATFVTQMELTNLGATGTFDGTIPIYFDEDGNGSIRGGLLLSRPPGGNVAYVGELTYEDLGTMGNYAFQTLRSLDYSQMSVELNGNLAGEIITNFKIDGVRQGEGTSQNFITRRLSKLPIRFNVNVRSENFYLLATIVRGLFDPRVFDTESARRGLNLQGLLSDGRTVPLAPFVSEDEDDEDDTPAPPPAIPSEPQRRDEPAVQPPESDDLP